MSDVKDRTSAYHQEELAQPLLDEAYVRAILAKWNAKRWNAILSEWNEERVGLDDVATVMRVYRTSPEFVRLLLDMLDSACDRKYLRETVLSEDTSQTKL